MSNVLLGVTAPSFADHPIGQMIGLGMNVSVNTDDPGYFSTTLERDTSTLAKPPTCPTTRAAASAETIGDAMTLGATLPRPAHANSWRS